jgi:hypothetical protein
VDLPAKRAKAIGVTLGAAIFVIPLGAMFYSIYWGWEVPKEGSRSVVDRAGYVQRPPSADGDRIPERRRRPPRRRAAALPDPDTLATSGPVRVTVERMSTARVRVELGNGTEQKLRIVVPGDLGRALRLVPAGSPANGEPGLAYDDARDAVVEVLPGDSYSRALKGVVPLGPFRAVYDTRGEGLPDGAWSGRAVSKAVR